MASRSRDYYITYNNYDQDQIDKLAALECVYIVYGKEIAPTTGTPHLQGYVRFKSPKTMSAALKALPGAPHIEIKRGT